MWRQPLALVLALAAFVVVAVDSNINLGLDQSPVTGAGSRLLSVLSDDFAHDDQSLAPLLRVERLRRQHMSGAAQSATAATPPPQPFLTVQFGRSLMPLPAGHLKDCLLYTSPSPRDRG